MEGLMPVTRPFKRTCRQFVDGGYAEGGRSRYIEHPQFAIAPPQQYIRAFEIIQKDLLTLFDYVEPADKNIGCYSYRVHELLLRTCIEIEANYKVILAENGYARPGGWNMGDYKKLNATHRLSSYQIKLPLWHGTLGLRLPFAPWASTGALTWYQAYNQIKHDRHEQFEQANFGHLVDAVAGLVALLAAQFYTNDFSHDGYLILDGPADGFETAIGKYFLVRHPDDWPSADRYEFNWQQLKSDPHPIQCLQF